MANAGDFAVSQAAELKDALDALTSNEFVMGDHHFSLQLIVRDCGLRRHRIRSGAAEVAQRPGRAWRAASSPIRGCWSPAKIWRSRPPSGRSCPETFRSGRASRRSHRAIWRRWRPSTTIPLGRADGNHWGEALTLLVTSAQITLSTSRCMPAIPRDPDGGSRKDTGHTLICGPDGLGQDGLHRLS